MSELNRSDNGIGSTCSSTSDVASGSFSQDAARPMSGSAPMSIDGSETVQPRNFRNAADNVVPALSEMHTTLNERCKY